MDDSNSTKIIKYEHTNVVLDDAPGGSGADDENVIAYVLANGKKVPVQPFARARTVEQSLGQKGWRQQAGNRIYTPEASNADIALIDPTQYFITAGGAVTGVIPIMGELSLVSMDYNSMLNLQYLRDAMALLGAVGRNDQFTYPLVEVGTSGIFDCQEWSSPNMYLGMEIRWGMQMLNAQAFDMVIQTTDFEGMYLQDVNRRFTIRVYPTREAGGTFQFLFGSRISGTSAGYYYDGSGGMNFPIIQPAVLPAMDVSVLNAPKVAITVPTGVRTAVSFNVQAITAASPALANLRERTLEGTQAAV